VRAESAGPLQWRNGKLKQAVAVASDRPVAAELGVLCLLSRGEAVALKIIPGTPAKLPPLEPGFDLLARQSQDAFAALSRAGHARLTLGNDPAEAIALLHTNRAALMRIAA
jgi:hypothetical protein